MTRFSIAPEQAAARGMPSLGFVLECPDGSMRGQAFPAPGCYFAAGGPPGTALAFVVVSSSERAASTDGVERAVRAELSKFGRAITVVDRSTLAFAGGEHAAIAFVTHGAHPAVWTGLLLVRAAGSLLITFGHGPPDGARLACETATHHPDLAILVGSFALVDPASTAQLEREVQGLLDRHPIERTQLLALDAGSLARSVLDSRQPIGGLGLAGLACAEQLRTEGTPRDALEIGIVAWCAALDGLAPGPIPPGRIAKLDEDIALQTSGFRALRRWMMELRALTTSAEHLDAVIQFLMRVRATWTVLDASTRP